MGTENKKQETTPGHGPQGIDKAPGEEPATDNAQFKETTQKGKQVDADPSEKKGKPVQQSSGESS